MSEISNFASNSTLGNDKKRKARGDNILPIYMRVGVEYEDTGLEYLILFEYGQ